ncbi:hypothetical protein CH063_15707, partial [Colletotrichum higginsianum]
MKTSVFLSLSALSAVAVSQATLYGQCGGQGWTGPTTCVSGARCVSYNDWYSQCVTGADEDVPVEEAEEPPVSGNDDDDDDNNNSGGDCDVGATPSAPQISTVEPTAVPSSTPVVDAPATTSAAETEPVVSETAAATATSSAAEEEDPVPTSAPATTLVTATQGPTTVIAVPSGVTKTLPQSSGA